MFGSCENNTLRFRRKGISKKEIMEFRKIANSGVQYAAQGDRIKYSAEIRIQRV